MCCEVLSDGAVMKFDAAKTCFVKDRGRQEAANLGWVPVSQDGVRSELTCGWNNARFKDEESGASELCSRSERKRS
jgi:hypothetical protein